MKDDSQIYIYIKLGSGKMFYPEVRPFSSSSTRESTRTYEAFRLPVNFGLNAYYMGAFVPQQSQSQSQSQVQVPHATSAHEYNEYKKRAAELTAAVIPGIPSKRTRSRFEHIMGTGESALSKKATAAASKFKLTSSPLSLAGRDAVQEGRCGKEEEEQ